MQLQNIRISNVLSFPYLEDWNQSVSLSFGTWDDSAVNILIWPNWSGKSNFINILEQIYTRGIIKDYIYNKKFVKESENIKNVIIFEKSYFNRLAPHRNFLDKSSQIKISFLLVNWDYDNIWFIVKNRTILNNIISKYSNLNLIIPEINMDEIRNFGSILTLKFDINFKDNQFVLVENELDDVQKFIYMCISNHELFQVCIDLYNDFEKEYGDRNWYPLKNSYAIIWYERKLAWVSHLLNPEFADQYFFWTYRQFGNSLMGFYLCIKKIWNILHNYSEENYLEPGKFIYSDKFIKNKLKKSPFFNSLNYIIKKYLDKELCVSVYEKQIKFYLIDEQNNEFIFSDLSDGEQSLLHMIFDIYGYDTKWWFVLFDEPEIHFHPQMQRSFIKMLEKISQNIKCQFVVSTYSPLIINEDNIRNVYRFQKDSLWTKIICPGKYIWSDESNLVHILKFDNASKMFFVNKIIMVEWETDAYFFQHYLEYLHTLPQRKDKIKNYEIININGKWWYKKWNQFLSKFWLETYFIWDWDNIVDYDILNQFDLNRYYKQSKSYYADMKRKHRLVDNHYGRLVNTLKNIHTSTYNHVINKIKHLYKRWVFILEKWDIETYLGMSIKGLDETIYFCQNEFEKWLNNKEYLDHRNEFESIFSKIFF